MRIITFNANGIRSAARKGFFEWLAEQDADVVCIQETKAQRAQLDDPVFHPAGYHCHYCDAQRKGYSGVAVYARRRPRSVVTGIGDAAFDAEGRWLELRYDGFAVVSLYLPSGSSGEHRQAEKFRAMDLLEAHFARLRRARREYIVCGDFNIAHTKKDIKNWRGNQKNSGFLPEERAWMDALFGPWGWVDAFRVVNTQDEQYTWWSNRGQARAKNVGWRIDYQVITPGLREAVRGATIYKDRWFSDHAPLIMDYALEWPAA